METRKLALALAGSVALATALGSTCQTAGASDVSAPDYARQNLLPYARPMCGTAADAFTCPGATMPFGMIQWSPDPELGQRKGGYYDRDTRISDFSVDHMSGAGCSYARILR